MAPVLAVDWNDADDVLIALAVLIGGYGVFRLVFPRLARPLILGGIRNVDEEMERRARTIVGVIEGTAGAVVVLIALIIVLHSLGVNVAAIVTGLGIGGLALALGAQSLVRDGLTGFFLLAEDQYRTGDVVRIADVTGTVESISLRRTIIRDDDGVVHSVPNGSINVVSNYTRDFAQVNVKVQVAYGEDLSRVNGVIERVGNELAGDSRYSSLFIEPPVPGRIESVGDGGVTVLVTARAKPSARWEAAAELRRRLADAFVREGVRVPFASVAADAAESSQPKAEPAP